MADLSEQPGRKRARENDGDNETEFNRSSTNAAPGSIVNLDAEEEVKRRNRINRHFAYSLISRAASDGLPAEEGGGWEEEELAKLVLLVAKEMEFDSKKLVRCLEETGTGKPVMISQLLELSEDFVFTPIQILSMLRSQSNNILDRFIALVGDALEQDLFDLDDDDTLELMVSAAGAMTEQEVLRFACEICDHSESKMRCGVVLFAFTKHLTEQSSSSTASATASATAAPAAPASGSTAFNDNDADGEFSPTKAARFIFAIVSRAAFLDLSGSLSAFFLALSGCAEESEIREEYEVVAEMVRTLLRESGREIGESGDLVESDEDSQGNLKDFIADSQDSVPPLYDQIMQHCELDRLQQQQQQRNGNSSGKNKGNNGKKRQNKPSVVQVLDSESDDEDEDDDEDDLDLEEEEDDDEEEVELVERPPSRREYIVLDGEGEQEHEDEEEDEEVDEEEEEQDDEVGDDDGDIEGEGEDEEGGEVDGEEEEGEGEVEKNAEDADDKRRMMNRIAEMAQGGGEDDEEEEELGEEENEEEDGESSSW